MYNISVLNTFANILSINGIAKNIKEIKLGPLVRKEKKKEAHS